MRLVGFDYFISNKREWNKNFVLLKTPTKFREFLSTLSVKTTDFQLVFHIWRAWYGSSYTIIAKPIRALELNYPQIQFLIK